MHNLESIEDLLKLQKKLDLKTKSKRSNGFTPRKRDGVDLKFALDDEFNEFMKELPDAVNFKYWKEKKHDAHKQLIEYVDCLFFLLAAINEFHNRKSWLRERVDRAFKRITPNRYILSKENLSHFKYAIAASNLETDYDLIALFDYYFSIGEAAGYNHKNILDAYWEKWNMNMGRDKKDWILGGNNG